MAAYERSVRRSGAPRASGLIPAAVRRSSRPSASSTGRAKSPTPIVSAAAKNSRRRRVGRAAPPGPDNEALGDPPHERARREAERATEDRRPDQGLEVWMNGVARPED